MLRAAVVIPTYQGRDRLAVALGSLERQTRRPRVVVVDNASTDGTAELVAERFPWVEVERAPRNLGFGRAINLGVRRLDGEDVLVLVNNDAVCDERFVERICAPFADPQVGMVAGVLVQEAARDRIDTAGIELDVTFRGHDYFWNRPLAELRAAAAPPPAGPCGGAAAYRLDEFRRLGGFDETLFAYWEDTDLALRFREAGWRCALAADAVAEHRHGATLGAGSPRQRRLDAFGRGYLLGKYRIGSGDPALRARIAVLDWPVLAVHLAFRREAGPLVSRVRGWRAGRARPAHPLPPRELATIPLRRALASQLHFLLLRLRGRAPEHYAVTSPGS